MPIGLHPRAKQTTAATAPAAPLSSIIDWLAAAASQHDADGVPLFGALCEKVCDAGVPLARSAIQLENLHPLYYGYCLHWRFDEAAYELPRSFGFAESEEFRLSPYTAALRAGGAYRRRLEGETAPELPLLVALKGDGYTDFLALVIPTGAAMPPGISFATRDAGGFTDGHIGLLSSLIPYLGLAFGNIAERRKTEAVLATYLGAGPGRDVAEGRTRRGDMRMLDAVVLFTDLRGFSAKSIAWDEQDLLAALSRYFEVVADAVRARGGEVLKFVGDGVLSLFPIADGGEAPARCRDAVAAISDARAALSAVNAAREAEGREPLAFVAALHAGSVSYGNIGARERLDFTVVGPAVNIASRLEPIAKQLGESTLMTASVADHCSPRPRSVGQHPIRGISKGLELFAM